VCGRQRETSRRPASRRFNFNVPRSCPPQQARLFRAVVAFAEYVSVAAEAPVRQPVAGKARYSERRAARSARKVRCHSADIRVARSERERVSNAPPPGEEAGAVAGRCGRVRAGRQAAVREAGGR